MNFDTLLFIVIIIIEVIIMYCLTAKNRITKRWEDIEYFKDYRQFDFIIGEVKE